MWRCGPATAAARGQTNQSPVCRCPATLNLSGRGGGHDSRQYFEFECSNHFGHFLTYAFNLKIIKKYFVQLCSSSHISTVCVIKPVKREDWQKFDRLSSCILHVQSHYQWHFILQCGIITTDINRCRQQKNHKNQPSQTRFPKRFFNK